MLRPISTSHVLHVVFANRRRWVRGCLASLSAVAVFALAVPAFATSGDYFVGASWWPGVATQIEGTTADIGTDNPVVKDTRSAAWTLVGDGSKYLLQDGWYKTYQDASPYYFWEYGDASSAPQVFPGSPQPGSSSHVYTDVLTDPVWSGSTLVSGTWNFEVDYVTLEQSTSILFTPAGVEDMGEVRDTNDQSPGGYSTGEQIQFSSVEYDDPSGWTTLTSSQLTYEGNAGPGDGPCGTTSGSDSYQYCYYSSSSFSIWDSRYSS